MVLGIVKVLVSLGGGCVRGRGSEGKGGERIRMEALWRVREGRGTHAFGEVQATGCSMGVLDAGGFIR